MELNKCWGPSTYPDFLIIIFPWTKKIIFKDQNTEGFFLRTIFLEQPIQDFLSINFITNQENQGFFKN